MPTALRQIADHARDAWDRAVALVLAARKVGAPPSDLDVLGDYAHAQRVAWLRADDLAQRADEHGPDPYQVLAALDYGADDKRT